MGEFLNINKYPKTKVCQDVYDFVDSVLEIKKQDIKPSKTFDKYPIWIYWNQGFENAPNIVQLCLNSVKNHIPNNAELILLDESNLYDYVTLPQYVIDKVGENYTHLSDIIRTQLLYLYGGLWLDSTVLVDGDIDESIFEQDFWSPSFEGINTNLSNYGKFFLNCMATKKNSELMYTVYNILCSYWENNTELMDYDLIDGVFDYACRENKEFRSIVDKLTPNNEHYSALCDRKIYASLFYYELKIKNSNTIFFKTTYKVKPNRMSTNTVYDYFVKKYDAELEVREWLL